MSFIYGLCSYLQTPLAEYNSGGDGRYKTFARGLLARFRFSGDREFFEQDNLLYSGISEESKLSVIVVTDRTVSTSVRNAVVDQIRNAFAAKYLATMSRASPLSKSAEFGPEIKRIFASSVNPAQAKLAQINANLDQAELVMSQNLQTALDRTAQLQQMEAKSEEIKASAMAFEREAQELKKAMCCQKYRCILIVTFVLIALLGGVGAVLGVVLSKKKPSASPSVAPTPSQSRSPEATVSPVRTASPASTPTPPPPPPSPSRSRSARRSRTRPRSASRARSAGRTQSAVARAALRANAPPEAAGRRRTAAGGTAALGTSNPRDQWIGPTNQREKWVSTSDQREKWIRPNDPEKMREEN